jgi:uncharacterized membrane protein YkoI
MAYDDKATVSIDSEGAVLKCAKGLEASECGFTPGAKVCGKCGAMPVEMKMVPATDLDIADEDMTEDEMQKMYGMMPKKKKKPGMHMMPDGSMMADEDMQKGMDEGDEEEEMGEDEVKINTSMDKFKKKGEDEEELDGPQSDEDEFEADVQDEDEMGLEDDEADPEEEMDSEDDEDMAEAEKANIMMDKFKKQRLSSMGIKSEDIGEHGYVCAIERKSYSGTTSVCENCPGGCIAEKGMPGLLHVEGMAEDMFDGKVIDSGYSPDADMFVVDVQAKDGKAIEVFIDGTSAEVMGWHKLDESVFEQKAAIDELNLISFTDAAEIAVKSIDGHVVAVEPDSFEGIDSYAVEIEGFDGKSYDVFVALDGEVLGYDKYEPEEAEEIEAEAAEIALKRAFTEEQRNAMAEEGNALPDGSYPISNESDLRNAVQAFGRAKDKEAAKRHIMKRARELGKENLIPAGWVAGGEGMSKKNDETLDGDFMKSLVEFQLLEVETDTI